LKKKKAAAVPAVEKEIEPIFQEIVKVIEEARRNTYRAINSEMVRAYWNIGRIIVEVEQLGEQKAEYGTFLLSHLSQRLTDRYGRGFNTRNLRYIRKFYLQFTKWNAVRSELTWTHYRLLLKIDNTEAIQFYINESIENRWSTRQLERQINSHYYERLMASKDKSPVIAEMKDNIEKMHPKDIIKEPYVLEFLDLKEGIKFLESELEAALIENLKAFMLELGKGFAFVDRQYRISLDGDHFYIDLVFYNYILKCFLLIDLKTGKLSHGDIGQMDFYVRYFEKEVRGKDDNPTIGLVLCADKNEAMVQYTLLSESEQVFASKYRLYLPSEEELRKEIKRGLGEGK